MNNIRNKNTLKESKQISKTLVTKQQVKSMISSQVVPNYADESSSGSSTTSPTFQDLLALAPGTGQNVRSGASLLLKKVKIFYTFTLGDTTNFMRLVIFKWFPSNTADAPTSAELFFGGTAAPWCSPFFGGVPSRFKILSDTIVDLDVAHVVKHGTVTLKLNDMVEYDNGVNTGRNHIYWCIVSDSSAVPHPTYLINTQLHYTQ